MRYAQLPHQLNVESRRSLTDLVDTLNQRYGNRLRAIILFGSVARQQESPMSSEHSSDIDLFVIFDQESDLSLDQRLELFGLVGDVDDRHRDNLREINIMPASNTLREWDDYFLEQVARDGIVLSLSGSLPAPLRPLEGSPAG